MTVSVALAIKDAAWAVCRVRPTLVAQTPAWRPHVEDMRMRGYLGDRSGSTNSARVA